MNRNRYIPTLLLLTFLLGACSSGNPPAQASTSETTAQPVVTESQSTTRQAVISEVQNNVSARQTSNNELAPASNGLSIFLSGSIETGEDGRARLDLLPEGTIVRVGPNSSFSLPVLTEENGAPKTKLELLYGKIFILLKGGSLDVHTPSGVASVRGSLLSVQYDADKGRIEADCLEGHCSLENENGDDVELTDGQASFIEGDEQPPSDPEAINREGVQDWLDENPDLQDYMNELPNPEEYPEDSNPPDGSDQNNATEAPATDEPTTDQPAIDEPATEAPSSYIPIFGLANISVNYR